MNYNSLYCCDRSLKCSLADAIQLRGLVGLSSEADTDNGFELVIEHSGEELDTAGAIQSLPSETIVDIYLVAEENGNTEYLTNGTLKFIGRLVEQNNLPCWRIDFAHTASRVQPETLGGGRLDIMPDGTIRQYDERFTEEEISHVADVLENIVKRLGLREGPEVDALNLLRTKSW